MSASTHLNWLCKKFYSPHKSQYLQVIIIPFHENDCSANLFLFLIAEKNNYSLNTGFKLNINVKSSSLLVSVGSSDLTQNTKKLLAKQGGQLWPELSIPASDNCYLLVWSDQVLDVKSFKIFFVLDAKSLTLLLAGFFFLTKLIIPMIRNYYSHLPNGVPGYPKVTLSITYPGWKAHSATNRKRLINV